MSKKSILFFASLLFVFSTTTFSSEHAQIQVDEFDRNVKHFSQPKKHTTFVVFMAADNDLYYFAQNNIKQMEKIGSNKNINIIVQINAPGQSTPTQRLYIEKNNIKIVSPLPGEIPEKYNSGCPQTLIDCMKWAHRDFPADHYALIMWDHATGSVDPGPYRTINTNELFFVNPENDKLELDRSVGFLSILTQELTHSNKRAVCFDDTYKSYISNQELYFAIREIHLNVLKRPLDAIGFDACLMGMVEIANIMKDHVNFMVSSQEIEFGWGWNYTRILEPFNHTSLSPENLCRHIVKAYDQEYKPIANDYTQSAFDLSITKHLEKNINNLAFLLMRMFSDCKAKNIKSLIKLCKSPQYCTCFDEPSYIDLWHFYKNLQSNYA